jgi:hypothetical protein
MMLVSSFAVLASAENGAEDTPAELTPYERWQNWAGDGTSPRMPGNPQATNVVGIEDHFTDADGPYPPVNDDGSPKGVDLYGEPSPGAAATPYGHYVSDKFWEVPYGPGGGWALQVTGGSGDYGVGGSHEVYVGDVNGDSVINWVAYYSFAPMFTNGVDDDGDGCVDEKTYGDYSGQSGCDMIPDGFVYWSEGSSPDAGGEDGSLMVVFDLYGSNQLVAFRAGVTPPWGGYHFRGHLYYPGIDFVSDFAYFYSYEGYWGMNVNAAAGDTDTYDTLIGTIDMRGFPLVAPTANMCGAGTKIYMGALSQLDDGRVIGTYHSYEYSDGRNDWNDDGDTYDNVGGYFVIDPVTGDCDQGVNLGMYMYYPRPAGNLVQGGTTYESSDRRDWNGDGDTWDAVLLWHDVSTSLSLVGQRYSSTTWTAPVPTWGFGYTGCINDYGNIQSYPIKFGGSYYEYIGYPFYYATYFWLKSDDDGIPNTMMPQYYIEIGQPESSPGEQCIGIYTREWYLSYGGVRLMPGTSVADGNGDGDDTDTISSLFCPDETGGGGEFVIEETSKYAQGLYIDDFPAKSNGYVYFAASGMNAAGWGIMPSFWVEQDDWYYYGSQYDDANGDLLIGFQEWYTVFDWRMFGTADFEILELDWALTGDVQPGGTVVARMKLQNTGGIDIPVMEDDGIENDKGFKLQGLSAFDTIADDGVMQPGETATYYFAITVSAGSPIGPMDVKIIVTAYGATKEETITIPIILKMFGNDLSCYRHRQNALRTLRAFDSDDDEGMTHNLEPGDEVRVGDTNMPPEAAILLLLSWYEMGCNSGTHENVEQAHSESSHLTGQYGMGISYWGLNPGQEEGNEGNGNGGLTGQDWHDVYG